MPASPVFSARGHKRPSVERTAGAALRYAFSREKRLPFLFFFFLREGTGWSLACVLNNAGCVSTCRVERIQKRRACPAWNGALLSLTEIVSSFGRIEGRSARCLCAGTRLEAPERGIWTNVAAPIMMAHCGIYVHLWARTQRWVTEVFLFFFSFLRFLPALRIDWTCRNTLYYCIRVETAGEGRRRVRPGDTREPSSDWND